MRRLSTALVALALLAPAAVVLAADKPAPVTYVVPKPLERGLKNQMKVLFIEDHRLPMVHYRFVVRAGSADEQPEKAGLANFMLEVMQQGTEKRDHDTLARSIDQIGGQIDVNANRDFMAVTGQFLSRDWRQGLDILSDIVQNPAFRNEEVERSRGQILGALQASRDQNAALAAEHVTALVYGEHPYARPVNGDPGSVNAITRDDLIKFHQTYFRPNLALLVVVGDIDANTALGDIEAQFRDWNKSEPPSRPGPALPTFETNRIRLLDKPEVTQTELRIGYEGVPRSTPDFYAIQVMNYILGGGGFSSRILDAVRSKGGLTYTANTSFDFGRDKGAFYLSTFTRNEAVGETIDLALSTMKKFQQEGPTEKEVEDAKRFLVSSLPLSLQTSGALAAQYAGIELYGLGMDYFQRYPDQIRAVTVADVKRVATERLREDKLAIVAVSTAGEVKSQLEKFGPVEVLDYRSPTGAIPQSKPTQAMPAEAITAEAKARAKSVIDKALVAHGGATKIKAVSDVSSRAALSITTPNGSVDGDLLMAVKLPDKTRIEMNLLGQRGVQVLNGDHGWTTTGDRVVDLSAEQTAAMKAGLRVQVLPLLSRMAQGTVEVGWVGREAIGADSVDVLLVGDPESPARAAFSRSTGLLVRLEQDEPSMFGQGKVPMSRLYSDYREVSGIKLPFKTERFARGERLVADTVSAYEVNHGIAESLFQRPAR